MLKFRPGCNLLKTIVILIGGMYALQIVKYLHISTHHQERKESSNGVCMMRIQ